MRLKRQLAALSAGMRRVGRAPGACRDARAEPPRDDPARRSRRPRSRPPRRRRPRSTCGSCRPRTLPRPRLGGRIAPRAQARPTPVPPPSTPRSADFRPGRPAPAALRGALGSRTVKGSYLGVSTSPVRGGAAAPQPARGRRPRLRFRGEGQPRRGRGAQAVRRAAQARRPDPRQRPAARRPDPGPQGRRGGEAVDRPRRQAQTVNAKLVEKDVRPLPESFFGTFDPNHPDVGLTQPPDVAFRDVFEHANRSVDVRKSDDRTVVAFRRRAHPDRHPAGGEAHLTAKDKRADRVFDGPIDTKDERAKVPGEIAELKQLESVRVQGETR